LKLDYRIVKEEHYTTVPINIKVLKINEDADDFYET
jgi:hypothetical protein